MTIREQARERARRGAALLDERGPKDWARRIDTSDYFTIDHPCRCVVGQLYGRFVVGCKTLGVSSLDVINHGFADADTALDDAWREEIRLRVQASAPEPLPDEELVPC